MTQRLATQEEAYLAASESFEQNGAARDPSWARELRKAALARFRELGFPTARRGNEEWKYTDVGPVARVPAHAPGSTAPLTLSPTDVEEAAFGEMGWPLLVFVNGRYDGGLSSLSSLPDGVTATNLSEAMQTSPDIVQQRLARYADYESNAFTALNTAFVHEGAFVHIPKGVQVEDPIRLLFLSTPENQETVSHPRTLIVTGEDSKVTVIESYKGVSDGQYFTNAVTEALVGAGAKMDYYKAQRQSEQAFHITNTHVALERDSSFASVNIDMGGRLTRNNLNLLTLDRDCSCTLDGFYMVNGSPVSYTHLTLPTKRIV